MTDVSQYMFDWDNSDPKWTIRYNAYAINFTIDDNRSDDEPEWIKLIGTIIFMQGSSIFGNVKDWTVNTDTFYAIKDEVEALKWVHDNVIAKGQQ